MLHLLHVALCFTPSFKYCNVIHINVCEENLKMNTFSETVPVFLLYPILEVVNSYDRHVLRETCSVTDIFCF